MFVAKNEFTAFGKTFIPGAAVTAEDVASWPAGTLERRLEGGDIGIGSGLENDAVAASAALAESEAENAQLEEENRLLKERLDELKGGGGGKKGKAGDQ